MIKGNKDYFVGDVIRYRPMGGGFRDVRVEDIDAEIKNGCSGFDGSIVEGSGDYMTTGEGVWGYDSQILSVLARGDQHVV